MMDCVVVGAGHAGLALSWHLMRRGIEHSLLEQGRIGESWRSQRWDTFALNTPAWANRLPGDSEDAGPHDAFLVRDAWVARLDDYVRTHALPARTGVRVTAVERSAHGAGFVLRLAGADKETVRARSVVLASGFQRLPQLPAAAAAVPAGITSLHAADYRCPEALPAGAVLVVGSGQSGGQIAEDLLDAGRDVFMSASAVGRLPRRYRGRDIFEWLVPAGFFDQTVAQLRDPRMATAAQPIISGVGRYGHTLSLQFLAGRGARLVGRLRAIEGQRLKFEADLADSIRTGDRVSAEVRAGIEKGIAARGGGAPDLEPDPADEPLESPDEVAARAPQALDFERDGITTIIWSTGFGVELGWVRLPVRDDRGRPIHTDGAAPVSGVWFLGVPWMRSRRSGIVLGADAEGRQTADAVAAYLAS